MRGVISDAVEYVFMGFIGFLGVSLVLIVVGFLLHMGIVKWFGVAVGGVQFLAFFLGLVTQSTGRNAFSQALLYVVLAIVMLDYAFGKAIENMVFLLKTAI